jgi:hypothetical protein
VQGTGSCDLSGQSVLTALLQHQNKNQRSITQLFEESVQQYWVGSTCFLAPIQANCTNKPGKRCTNNFYEGVLAKVAFFHDVVVLVTNLASAPSFDRHVFFADNDMVFLQPISNVLKQIRMQKCDFALTPTEIKHNKYVGATGFFVAAAHPPVLRLLRWWAMAQTRNMGFHDQLWLHHMLTTKDFLPAIPTTTRFHVGDLSRELVPVYSDPRKIPRCGVLFHAYGGVGDTQKLQRLQSVWSNYRNRTGNATAAAQRMCEHDIAYQGGCRFHH